MRKEDRMPPCCRDMDNIVVMNRYPMGDDCWCRVCGREWFQLPVYQDEPWRQGRTEKKQLEWERSKAATYIKKEKKG